METIITRTNKDIFYLMDKHIFNKDWFFINPVNTVGVMGKGLAKEFKSRIPDHFIAYKEALDSGDLKIGQCYIDNFNNIIDFPTKNHWRGKSKIEYITKGLIDLVQKSKKNKIDTLVMPQIGSGLGGLDYEKQVKPEIIKILKNSSIRKVILIEWNMKKYYPKIK